MTPPLDRRWRTTNDIARRWAVTRVVAWKQLQDMVNEGKAEMRESMRDGSRVLRWRVVE